MLNLDTHVLLYAVADQLTPTERRALSLACPAAQLGLIELDLDDPDVTRTLSGVRVWPITVEIAKQSTRLDFRGDPADELIAATSVVHNVPLITRDRHLRRSSLVPLAPSRS